ncbi:hypothetical protein EVAR_43360_1 [Eumeta japonica]|uniref:Uncharacterized protein n=1 Tax=Eumeta variegata TaxID=151549 RepID=A0A4C1WSI0_EUMVA|nr:hypothetical protein EVAR_43360_1 [Eumeta japonica]
MCLVGMKLRLQTTRADVRDYALYSAVQNSVRGNFSGAERACPARPAPHFVVRRARPARPRAPHRRARADFKKSHHDRSGDGDALRDSAVRTRSHNAIRDHRTRARKRKVDSEIASDGYYFRRKLVRGKSRAKRQTPAGRERTRRGGARAVAGALTRRSHVSLKWALADPLHLQSDVADVIFR